MRIGIDVRELEQNKRTGIGRFLTNLFHSELFRRAPHDWILFGNQRTVFPEGFSTVRIAERSRLAWDHVVLPRQLRRRGIHVFFSPYRKAPWRLPCPFIITIHDLFPFTLPGRRAFGDLPFWWFIRQVARRAARILTVSEFVKQDVVTWLRVAPAKVQVIYHGLEPSFCPVDPDHARAQLLRRFGIGDDYVLFVGQLKPHKNVDKLIEAYARLPDPLRRQCRLVIVGSDGAYRARLEALGVQRGLTDRLRWLGVVDDDLLPVLYSAARVCVLPSQHEGFGLPVIEAMACGCPVIAADRAALPEIAGEAALFVNPDDSAALTHTLERLLSDGALRHTFQTQGYARARMFSIDHAVEQLLRAFDTL